MKKIFIFGIVLLYMAACEEEIPGCMDIDAENFDPAANVEGPCFYRGSAIIYHDKTTGQKLIDEGVTNVKLYVDGVFQDAMSPFVGFTFVPTCEHPDGMSISNYGIGTNPSQTFNYTVRTQDERILDQGTFTIYGNQCTAIQYNY
jgi:hypothetical protein